MKRLLKFLLIPLFVFAGIYTATPLWLPHILAGQLPQGWQLQAMRSGYPGLTGINIHEIHVTGGLAGTDMTVISSGLRFTYQGLITEIDQVAIDVFVRGKGKQPDDPVSLDDLALPVTNLTGKLPRLSIRQLHLAVRLDKGLHGDIGTAARPLLFEFDKFDLTPDTDQGFHLASRVEVADSFLPPGRLDVDVAPGYTSAFITFPSAANQPPWLVMEIVQEDLAGNTTTDFQAALNTEYANREWLDSLLAGNTGQMFTHVGGKIEIGAGFSGQDLQNIGHLSVISNNLLLVTDKGSLNLDTSLTASRDGEKVAIKLMTPTKLVYQGNASRFDELLAAVAPGLHLPGRSEARIISKIGSGSRIEILPFEVPSASFIGDISIDLSSGEEQLSLHSDDLHLDMPNMDKADSITAIGSLKLDWNVSGPVSYTTQTAKLDASGMSISTDLVSNAEKLASTGFGSFTQVQLTPLSGSIGTIDMDEIEMDWQDLDPVTLTGKLGTRSHGFSTEFNNETWKGFDFDIKYRMLNGTDIDGSGNLKTEDGVDFPIGFAGNTETNRWNVKLMPSSVPLTKLGELLSLAHYDLPASVELADGLIELQGDIVLDGDIEASVLVRGSDVDVSMYKSRAMESSFTLNTAYDTKMWAQGPVIIESMDLAGGIDVSNIRFDIEIDDTQQIGLKNLHAELFDGLLEGDSLQFSENSIEDTVLDFSHIDFGLLLNYADIDGLEGSGFLDISLPIVSDQAGVQVINGTFFSTGPGRLAYSKEGMAASNIGLQALENFHYKELSGTLNYQSDGTYLMAVRLEGKNPDLYGGHPVLFNLNVNGSLPALFDAMFRTGSFEEAILKEIKSR